MAFGWARRLRTRWSGARGVAGDVALPQPLSVQRMFELTTAEGARLPEAVTVLHAELGELALPDGRLVACDPWFENVPVSRRLEPGRYRVQARIADFDDGRDQRTAAALLWVSDAAPVAFEPATTEGGDAYGLGVDSGTACFASPRAVELLAAEFDDEAAEPPAGDTLMAALERTYRHTWSWANHPLADDVNVVAFSTGFGDGIYPVFWGLDASGEPVCALID